MRRLLLLLVLTLTWLLPAGSSRTASAQSAPASSKISGEIFNHRDLKREPGLHTMAQLRGMGLNMEQPDAEDCALYVTERLTKAEIDELSGVGIVVHDVWVPAVPGKHPYGFHLATVDYDSLSVIERDARITRLDTTEQARYPLNDLSRVMTNVEDVHAGNGVVGYDGTGVKIAVADSGFDVTHADVPLTDEVYDVTVGATFLSWDTDVSNTVTDHGTHVLGIVGGTGALSGGTYAGSAPGATYNLYKIGNDSTGSATSTDEIKAMVRAKNEGCKIFSMSYGGISEFMDGSGSAEQTIDAMHAGGMLCFISAGNDRGDGMHDSASVAPSTTVSSGLTLTVDNTGGGSALVFPISIRVIWIDDNENDGNMVLDCTNKGAGESVSLASNGHSSRGTEGRRFVLTTNIAAGTQKTYNLTLENTAVSGETPLVHLYNISGLGEFDSASDSYLVGSPALADSAVAVAAWVHRENWTNYQGFGYTILALEFDEVAYFSSPGPRIDEVQKPDLAAPGAATISLRDSGSGLANSDPDIIDNDGLNLNGSGPANYYVAQGTSMATPFAAGIAGLLLEIDPTLTPDEVVVFMSAAGSNSGSPDSDSGYGLVDALAAAQAVEALLASEADLFDTTGGGAAVADGGGPIDMGSTLEGEAALTRTFTLTNNGNGTLECEIVGLPVNYGVTEALDATIAPTQSDSFTLELVTSSDGTFAGDVEITTNDSDENPYTFSVTGTIIDAVAEVGVTDVTGGDAGVADGGGPVDLGTTNFGDSPLSRTFRVANTGTIAMSTSGLSVPAGYSVSEGLDASIDPGQNDTFTIQLPSSEAETFGGTVSFGNNDDDENPFNFTITGRVIGLSTVYVDFGHVGSEDGSESLPFNTLAEAQAALEPGGTMMIQAGTSSETGTYAKAGRLEADGGAVRIGAAP